MAANEEDPTEKILLATCTTLKTIEIQQIGGEAESDHTSDKKEKLQQHREGSKTSGDGSKCEDEEKECTSMMSAMSNEEASILSEILDQKSFRPRKGSDGEDVNGHIGHIDSPETDTCPNSEALQGESLLEDLR